MDRKIISDFKARRLALGLSVQDLAASVHKDESTVKKQLSDKSSTGMQLSTALEYANALEGTLQFVTFEEQATKSSVEIDLLNHRLAELIDSVITLTAKLTDKL